MLHESQVETLLTTVSSMDKPALVDQFLNFHGRFPVDFTPEFLFAQPTDRLRHIFVALCLQTEQLPHFTQPPRALAA